MINPFAFQSRYGLRWKALLALLAMSLLPLMATGFWTSRLVEKGVEVSVLELATSAELVAKGEFPPPLNLETHGGWIWIESEPGSGSQFWFSLPKKFTAPSA